jgi:trimeric autotransporter adhesin
MGTTLNGTTPQSTYPSLIKVGDNGAVDATLQRLSDGEGNDLPLLISTTDVTNYGSGAITSNTAFGSDALTANTTGSGNTAVGFQSLDANTTGSLNTAFGN